MPKKRVLSKNTYEKYREELKNLRSLETRTIEEQLRVSELKCMLNHSVVEDEIDLSVVYPPCKVTALNVYENKVDEIIIAENANSFDSTVSINSPIGSKMLGKSVGATVKLFAPKGIMFYVIQKISVVWLRRLLWILLKAGFPII